ncbi:ACT domain protein [uncultured archaeon]|nr:ACT domain protein [uncultured archaeon]
MEQLTIVENDRLGLLADIAGILGQSRINIDMLHAEAADGKAIIMLAVSDGRKARELLASQFALSVEQVAEVKSPIRFHPVAVQARDGPARLGA